MLNQQPRASRALPSARVPRLSTANNDSSTCRELRFMSAWSLDEAVQLERAEKLEGADERRRARVRRDRPEIEIKSKIPAGAFSASQACSPPNYHKPCPRSLLGRAARSCTATGQLEGLCFLATLFLKNFDSTVKARSLLPRNDLVLSPCRRGSALIVSANSERGGRQ